MVGFDFRLPTRIVFGAGRLSELGELARSIGEIARVLVVSDPGVVAAGHTQRGLDSLQAAGLVTRLFDGLAENPTTAHVEAGLAVAQDFSPDAIIGLGGGSSMDCAKGINFLYSCGGRMQDYWGRDKATGPLLPMIAVPTTAGTGSETQSFALISDGKTHVKMACGDRRAAFRVALLDPELTLTQPPRVTALTGYDALAHAVETAVSSAHTPMSLCFSREAWRRLAPNYSRVIENPNEIAFRFHMQFGACLAGLAIENSMLGGAHAMANPLTATFGIAHGEAVAIALPHIVRHNGQNHNAAAAYRAMLSATDGQSNLPLIPLGEGPAGLAEFLARSADMAGLRIRLRDHEIDRSRLPELAADATKQWTGTFNPVKLTEADFLRLYEAAY
jgi:alcohol dehydrogenase